MFEFIAGVFASPFIWIPLAILFFMLESYMVETNNSGKATALLIFVLIFAQVFTYFQPFTLMAQNPLWALIIIVGYLVIGMIYARYKWGAYIRRVHERISDIIDDRVRRNEGSVVNTATSTPATRLAQYRQNAIEQVLGHRTLPIQIYDNKARVTAWMSYWPASLAYTLFDDPLRRAVNYAFRRMSGALQRVSDRAHADFERKYAEPPQPKVFPPDTAI